MLTLFKPSLGVLLILSAFLLSGVTSIRAQVGSLPPSEVTALREIAKQLRKNDWDFSLNPCDGNTSWRTPFTDRPPQFNNSVVCNCPSTGFCHVIAIFLKGQDLTGVLPKSLAKLPYIKQIDLSYNYLNGTIPREWQSTKLEFLAVTGNRLSGSIPSFLGNMITLGYLCLEDNEFSGNVPAELGNLIDLATLVLNVNNLTGKLPEELNRLTNLIELRLSSNNFSGKIPNFNLTKLQKLEIQGSGLEGPIPETIFHLGNLTELRISDLSGKTSQIPDLYYMENMTKLMLRGCNITGTIPASISEMSNLRHLDLSFNNLEGRIPDDLEGPNLQKLYLTGNSLCGSIPDWIKNRGNKTEIDLSYNRFSEKSVPESCGKSLNLFRSYSGEDNLDLAVCLKEYSCSKEYYSVNINCGGPRVKIGHTFYEADQDPVGAAHFIPRSDHWGISNTGSLWDTNDTSNEYIATNVSVLAENHTELYRTARHSPLSLTYFGRCLANGNYTVTLHFAEIVFRDNKSYQGLGRRVFDVYVQGAIIYKNFDIKNEAGGVDIEIVKVIKNVTN